mgnify:CR=1 FL=1
MKDFDLRKYLAEGRLLKENKIAQAIRDEAEQEDSKVGAAIFKKYAKKIESASKEDYRKILTSMERELIDTHPDTFDGDDDIVASFMAVAENKLLKEDDLNEISRDAYDRMEGLANENKLNELKDLIMILGEDWANEGFENGDIADYLEALVYQLVRS